MRFQLKFELVSVQSLLGGQIVFSSMQMLVWRTLTLISFQIKFIFYMCDIWSMVWVHGHGHAGRLFAYNLATFVRFLQINSFVTLMHACDCLKSVVNDKLYVKIQTHQPHSTICDEPTAYFTDRIPTQLSNYFSSFFSLFININNVSLMPPISLF